MQYSFLEQFAHDNLHHIVSEARVQALPGHSLPAEPRGQQVYEHLINVLNANTIETSMAETIQII
jgi:hypothetical protein